MGKKSKPANNVSKTVAPAAQERRRFQWWQLLLPAAVALLVALIGIVPQFWKSESPQFALVKPITRPDSGIFIIAQNDAADRSEVLNIEFDGFLFANTGRLIPNSDPQRWHVAVLEIDLPDSLLRDGAHRVRVRFAGEEEPKKNNGLFLNDVFDRKQTWIWTSDKSSAGRAWCVDFSNGYCSIYRVDDYGYVHAVRRGQ